MSPTSQPDWPSVASAFSIGTPLFAAPVVGAWTNHVWRLRTGRGEFAVKTLSAPPDDGLQAALDLERAALADGRIPMAGPMTGANEAWLVEIDDTTFRCHEWVHGTPCLDVAPTTTISSEIGATLARIQALPVASPGTTADLPPAPIDRFEQAVVAAADASLAWSAPLEALAETVDDITKRYEELRAQDRPLVLSYRDIDPKNAIVSPSGRVILVDWDGAGPTRATSELLEAALSFAGGVLHVDESCVDALLSAYRSAGGAAEPPDEIDTAMLHVSGLDWLLTCVERCAGRGDQSRRREAEQFAPELLGSFVASVKPVDSWAERLRSSAR